MRFETSFRIQKWLIEHGPIYWFAGVVTWAWEKSMPMSKGFRKFREDAPSLENAEQWATRVKCYVISKLHKT